MARTHPARAPAQPHDAMKLKSPSPSTRRCHPAPTWAPRGAGGGGGAGQAPAPGLPLAIRAVKPAGCSVRVRAGDGAGLRKPPQNPKKQHPKEQTPLRAHPCTQPPQRASVAAVPGARRRRLVAWQRVCGAHGASPGEKAPGGHGRHEPHACRGGKGGEGWMRR